MTLELELAAETEKEEAEDCSMAENLRLNFMDEDSSTIISVKLLLLCVVGKGVEAHSSCSIPIEATWAKALRLGSVVLVEDGGETVLNGANLFLFICGGCKGGELEFLPLGTCM